ncbi:Mitochondrial inner membrane protease atp23 [Exophiala xenobiotica]|uniref:Mitochondrial inner membrane protease ATP23 n=1 Tax=Vermiconidia calcicola TaxID=1690605 RepID=A0AAV9PZ52_9PEZI|nr:Mitochondrial inner membrane protease atp23 [Exophiala xenobiotica]KAK5530642.1 Mitochondrial inner membrane protease atp23 [Chaetothyriales sp. CCFEE 6169]KAK5530805.1 Mitochondrial inner membrane protease atp23 [Vermiconidia calcicola]KAK5198105.1 Mitochondrial inner membrane protease atp23 [Exophiala xenobiotica]KAK5210440.1 Mitochondrial inner membrane protease atp23 [Exophiala xenobiotica]
MSSADSQSPQSPSSSSTPPQPGLEFLPSTTLVNRFKNFYRMATGSMSPEGQKAYWDDADQRYSEFDCKRCETWRDDLLRTSPVIRYMNDNIRKLGGDIGKHNIRCKTCKEGMLAGFDHQYGIKVCANWVQSKSMMEDVVAHEMVHAYDHLRFKTTLDEDLRHAACSESLVTNEAADPSKQPQRRMSVGERVLQEQGHEFYKSSSGLCAAACDQIGHGEAEL